MERCPTIGREIVKQVHLAVKLNNGDPVIRSKCVEKTGGGQLDVLPKASRRAAHVEHHHDAERRRCRDETRDVLLDAVFVDRKAGSTESRNRAAAVIDHTDIQANDRRVNADRVVILRDGRLVADSLASAISQDEIVRTMVGRSLADQFQRTRAVRAEVVLEVENLRTPVHPRGVSLTVRSGEVVALAGLIGAGRSELARAIFGDFPRLAGTVTVAGTVVPPGSPRAAIDAGIGLAPEDRKGQALVLIRSVLENTTLPILEELSVAQVIRGGRERAVADRFVKRLRVRTPSLDQDVSKLSGGNQQKVVLARWLATKPKVLILDEPTRGIDVGAKAEIYRLIDELAGEGMGVLLISSELPEVLGLADRILVMQSGRITGELAAETATERAVMGYAMMDDLASTGASA